LGPAVAAVAVGAADTMNSNLVSLTHFGASDACSVACAGDARITCGGQQQVNIYVENDATPRVLPPNDYSPVGCYK
jgi:hypothetical protein